MPLLHRWGGTHFTSSKFLIRCAVEFSTVSLQRWYSLVDPLLKSFPLMSFQVLHLIPLCYQMLSLLRIEEQITLMYSTIVIKCGHMFYNMGGHIFEASYTPHYPLPQGVLLVCFSLGRH